MNRLDVSIPVDAWSPSALGRDERERVECGFAGCKGGWGQRWKQRTRPKFEGQWVCGKECLRELVRVAVSREMEGAEGAEVASVHRHRVPLGLVLLAQGLVTEIELRRGLAAQRKAGAGRIGEWLVESCGVSERRVTRGLGLQWNCPVMATAGFVAPKMALAMPAMLREMCGVMPLRVAGGKVFYVAFDHEVDAAAAFALERMSGLKVESCLLRGTEFLQGMVELERSRTVACKEETVRSGSAMVEKMVGEMVTLQPVAARMVRLRDRYWMRLWLEQSAIGKEGMLPATGEDVVDRVYRVSAA